MSTSATQFATQELPFNFDNLFPHLIIHPNETIKGEEWKAWLTSVVLGIFTLGTLQLGCWIHEQYLQKKIEEKKTEDRLGKEKTIDEVFQKTVSQKPLQRVTSSDVHPGDVIQSKVLKEVPNEKPLTDNGEKTPSPQPTQNNLTSSVANTTNSSKKLAPIPDLSFPNCPTAAQYGDPLFGSPLYGHSWATWEKEGMGKAYQVLISTKNHEQACKQSYENLQIPFLQKVLPRLIIQLVDEVKQISQGVWEENSFARVLPLILVLEKKYQELVIKGCGKLFAVQFQHQCAEFADFLFKELAHQKGYGFFQYLLDPAQRASIDNENIEQLFASRVESDSIERKQACSFLLFLREQSFSSTPEPLSSEPTPLPYYPQVEGHSKEVWAAKGKLEDYYAQAPSVTKRQAVTAKYHNEQRRFLDKTLPGLSKIIMEEIDKVNEGTAWDRNSFEIVIDSLIHIENNYRDLGSEYWFKREFHKEFKLTHDLFFQNLAHVDEDTYLDYYESPDRDNIDFTNLNNLMDSLESPERPYCKMDRNACSFLLFIRKEYPNYCDG